MPVLRSRHNYNGGNLFLASYKNGDDVTTLKGKFDFSSSSALLPEQLDTPQKITTQAPPTPKV